MSVQNARNVTSVLIGTDIARTASVQYTDPSTTATYLADGEILMLGQDGAVLTTPTLTTNRFIRFVQRSGDNLKFTPYVDGNNLLNCTARDYAAGTEQVDTIGFDGTSGNIDASGTDPYKIDIEWTYDESTWSEQHEHDVYVFEDVASATAEDIAHYFFREINYKQLPPGRANTHGVRVRATMLMDEAGAAVTTAGTATEWAVTQDSDWVVPNGTLGAINFAVGDYLRFDQAGSPGDLDIPVYQIKAIDTTNDRIQLTTRYQGASDPALPEASDINFIAAATAAAADCGVVITAQELRWELDFFKYLQCTFRTNLGGITGVSDSPWGTTEHVTTDPVQEVGSVEAIAELESFTNGFEGALNRTVVPIRGGFTDADVTAEGYSTIEIAWADRSNYSPIGAPANMDQTIILAYESTSGTIGAQGGTTMEADLNAWIATTNLPFAAIALA
jgi:hypothetical protein